MSQEPEVRCKPVVTDSSEEDQRVSVAKPSPPTARKDFVPRPYTLKNVRDARLYKNPLTLATGLFNTVTDLVSERVNIGHVEKTSDNPVTSEPQAGVSEDEEEFKVCSLRSVRLPGVGDGCMETRCDSVTSQ